MYKAIVKNRQLKDDFVVSDDGYGYADDGEEGWDGDEDARQISEEEDSADERKGERFVLLWPYSVC